MPSVNKLILVGNLTREPVSRQLPGGSTVCEFGMAMNRKYKVDGGEEREEVCFVDCSAFGRPAEVIQQYCHKGKLLYVEARLRWDSWDDKNGGGKRSKLSAVVENFQFLGGKDDGGDREEQQARPAQSQRAPAAPRGDYDPEADVRGQAPPPRAPAGRAPAQSTSRRAAPQQPFGDEEQFKEQDIPF